MRFLLFLLPLSLLAHLNIAVSYPYIGAITKEIAQNHVSTIVLAKGNWDPHFVVPRPSLIAKLRSADALIMNGAQLEIGWLPPLIRRANNPKVNSNSSHFLNLAHYVELIGKPISVDRAMGDVHPDGNPHYHLDPRNIPKIAQTITAFLISIDAKHKEVYEKNYEEFAQRWQINLGEWDTTMQKSRGKKIIQFHNNLAYFNNAYGLQNIGTIEPLPGIAPSSRHTLKLISIIKTQKPSFILHDIYHSNKTAKYISSKTGIKVIYMPHDIGALKDIETLESLFDYMTKVVSDD
jgi:zinc/manganese transport system substrate-binding protein